MELDTMSPTITAIIDMLLLLVVLAFKTVLLQRLLRRIASATADSSLGKSLLIALLTAAAQGFVEQQYGPWIGMFTVLPILILAVAMIMLLCWVPFPRAFLVGTVFVAVSTGFSYGTNLAADRLMPGRRTFAQAFVKAEQTIDGMASNSATAGNQPGMNLSMLNRAAENLAMYATGAAGALSAAPALLKNGIPSLPSTDGSAALEEVLPGAYDPVPGEERAIPMTDAVDNAGMEIPDFGILTNLPTRTAAPGIPGEVQIFAPASRAGGSLVMLSSVPADLPSTPIDTSTDVPGWATSHTGLKVTGIIRKGREYLVLCHDQFVEVGGAVTVVCNGKRYWWRLMAVRNNEPIWIPVRVDAAPPASPIGTGATQ